MIRSDQIAEQLWFDPTTASAIQGHFYAEFGRNDAAVDDQYTSFGNSMSLMSGVTMTSTSDSSIDFFRSEPNTKIDGDIVVELGGGFNTGVFRHEVVGGDILRFVGGGSNDQIIQTNKI